MLYQCESSYNAPLTKSVTRTSDQGETVHGISFCMSKKSCQFFSLLPILNIKFQLKNLTQGHRNELNMGTRDRDTECFIYYCISRNLPRCTQLQYRFAAISEAPSTYNAGEGETRTRIKGTGTETEKEKIKF